MPIGFWDKTGLADGWFTDISQSAGWWDEDLLDESSGPTAYSLDCSAGSYSLSGQASLLSVGHTLTASAGTYSFSGQDATFAKTGALSYALDCLAGEYSISGQSALFVVTSVSSGSSIATGFGSKPGRRKYAGYPRWVLVAGNRYRVTSPDDERSLLEKLAAEARADEALFAAAAGVVELRAARARRVRVENRIERVDPRAADWHSKLRREDDELLQILGFVGVTADE